MTHEQSWPPTSAALPPEHPWRGNILIVDDTIDNIRLLSALLSDCGYRVRKAIDAELALTAVERELPDLILLDINMPGRNGYDTCRLLKANPKTESVPVIFLSALDDLFDKVQAFKVGGVDYITKPFQLEEVLARIETQLSLQRARYTIERQNHRLQETLAQLEQTQLDLVRQAQLMGMGQLALEVGQEIDNPMSCIRGNVGPAQEYVDCLFDVLTAYRQAYPAPPEWLRDRVAAADLDFIREDFPRLLLAMKHGTDRIEKVVTALGGWAQLDGAQLQVTDLNATIDRALRVLTQQLQGNEQRPAIAVLRHYGDLPSVACYCSQITWVIIDGLRRAIAATDRAWALGVLDGEPTIEVETAIEAEQFVRITLTDRGCAQDGVDRPYRYDSRLSTNDQSFEQDLNLQASRKIVTDNHRGVLTLTFDPGYGSTRTLMVSMQLDRAKLPHPD